MRMTTFTFVLGVAALGLGGQDATAEQCRAPRIFGRTLADWMTSYWRHQSDGTLAQGDGAMQFIEVPAEEYVSGSFTTADPGLLRGHGDVSLRAGAPFAMPVAVWYGERYNNGLPDDAAFPASIFTESHVRVTIDREVVMDSLRGEDAVDNFYFGPTSFDPLLSYPTPTDYGSVATIFLQGLGFVHHPLRPGVHTMTLQSEIIVNIPGYYGPGADLDLGVRFENTWTITVSR